MPTVYSYLRFSRPEQVKGDSLRRQLERTRAWAARKKLPLDESLSLQDKGISAFRGKNAKEGALAMFLECVATGRVKAGDYLVLESLDRLSRQRISKSRTLIEGILEAGVSIVTLEPERVYTAASIDDLASLSEMILVLSRANEESEIKSSRITAANAAKRDRAREGNAKLTSIAPLWLKPIYGADRKVAGFEPIADRVDVVERIFNMAGNGMGTHAIAKRLNQEGVAPFGKADLWHVSYVKKVLANRSVLGECQPHKMVDGKRQPCGDAIKDYFPAIIDERTFYSVQRSTEERIGKAGRHGKKVANLFTGLVKDARDGSNLVVVDKRSKANPGKAAGPSLVSRAAKEGKRGAVYVSFPYDAFEDALLVWGHDLKLGDVLPRKATNLQEEINKIEGRVADLDHRIGGLKSRIKTAGNFEALLDLLTDLEQERVEAKAKVERLKRENTTQEGEALDRTKELIDRLHKATEEEAYDLRVKLRSTLRQVVRDIVVLVIQVNGDRVALVDVELASGKRRKLTIMGRTRIILPDGLEDLDLRQWEQWPKAMKKVRFEALTEEAQAMLDMDAEGLNRTEIAERLGTSLSNVSRTLLHLGKRKRPRKSADSERLMTWHKAGRGWVKRHRGQRYFIGVGKLQEAYPRLVKDKTEEGTWKAANAWWKATLADAKQVVA